MKILHICLANFYIDGYSYQENILPREHKILGYDVEILASTETFIDNNNLGYKDPGSYYQEDGILVTRLPYKKIINDKISRKLRSYIGLEEYLENSKPDILFIHNLQFRDTKILVKYLKKNPNVIVYSDSHTDFTNSARNFISLNILHRIIYKRYVRRMIPYVKKFWGVLPARVDFLINIYGIPQSKVDLLVMGAEDNKVNNANGTKIRERYLIKNNDILIVTGGKIDRYKMQTLTLMKVINQMTKKNVKLLIFGSVSKDLQNEFNELLSENIIYAGWISSDESYNFIEAANLVVFPGRHSVLWEQTLAQEKALIVKYFPGMEHLNQNNNIEYLYSDSIEEIKNKIEETLDNPNKIIEMENRNKQISKKFLYSSIAKKSIEMEG